MNNKKKLSICADDFGITEKVNNAIVKLISLERITETSCIVLTDSFKSGAKDLIKYKNKIGVGLHLTLTDFKSLSELKSLSKNNNMGNVNNIIIKSIRKKIPPEEIIKEINLQLDLFEKIIGCSPNFIDGHHHVQQLPIIRECLIEVIKKRYSENLPWIRNASENFSKILKRKTSIIKSLIIGFFGKKTKELIKINSIRSNDGFSGIYDFSTKLKYETLFKNFIFDISNDHLLMVHPGQSDELLSTIDSVTFTRDLEFDFLSSDSFLDILNKNNIELKPLFL